MWLRIWTWSALVSAVLATACGGSVCADGDGCGAGGGGATGGMGTGGTGATGGTGRAPSFEQACSDACKKVSCPSYDSATCFSDCAQAPASVPSECRSAYQAVIACAAYKGTFVCNSSEPELMGCDTEMNAVVDCFSNAGF
jgi:hypothetical protein